MPRDSLSSTKRNYAMNNYNMLFSPFQIKSMILKNRIVMSPMGSNFAQSDGQRVISFSKSRETSSYTDTLYASDYSSIISTVWESIAIRWDSKERFLSKGGVDYYSNGVENSYSEEQYLVKNGKEYLSCTIERKRNEDGSLASEKITNYDENGKVKQ